MKAYLVTSDGIGFSDLERIFFNQEAAEKYAELKNTEVYDNTVQFCVGEVEINAEWINEVNDIKYVGEIPYMRIRYKRHSNPSKQSLNVEVCKGNQLDNRDCDFTKQHLGFYSSSKDNDYFLDVTRPLKGVYDGKIMVEIYNDVATELINKIESMIKDEDLSKDDIEKWFNEEDSINEVINLQQEGRYKYKSQSEQVKEHWNNILKANKMKKEAQKLIDQAKEAGMFTKTESED
ncbi:hypothetical protein ACI3ER_11380 [Bacillus sp. Wb]